MRRIDDIMDECSSKEEDGANEWQATKHLNDEEFKAWYIESNRRWFDKYKKYHEELLCEKCKLDITNYEQYRVWEGVNYHLPCMLVDLSSRELREDYKSLYTRILKVFPLPNHKINAVPPFEHT